ncbi:MAG: hypothetical protein ROR55_19740 [Devosia sp.]
MSSHPFSAHITIAEGILIEDFECQVEAVAEPDGYGGVNVRIVAVWAETFRSRVDGPPFSLGRVELLKHQDLLAALIGGKVKKVAEEDARIVEEAIASAGFTYLGRGGSDPDGRWVRRAAA